MLPVLQADGRRIYGFGMVESGMSFNLEQFVIDNEIGRAVRKSIEEMDVNEETIALDTIKNVGPGPKSDFLGEKHTRDHIDVQWQPELFDRNNWETWERTGKKDTFDRACDKVDKILETHEPKKLDPDTEKKVKQTVKKADEKYAK
ncbi:hypothetical protein AKJ49_00040 [candidate division MSBL1 archaeon SCGC-AAA382A03]|uniref:Trimethylamine methyltransferase n=1 Tax=candidate division MSBL1 archaeon SCGC-AAA382A03 TaxID=1698278 RepID=A0A133VH82_9EURY|nr:hypothetical protein AKJ49_00040 [candidate division MSBL1 archaeon SCGC-AAA382A03]